MSVLAVIQKVKWNTAYENLPVFFVFFYYDDTVSINNMLKGPIICPLPPSSAHNDLYRAEFEKDFNLFAHTVMMTVSLLMMIAFSW